MLEPFQNRGREWIIEPRRNRKGELPWAGEYAGKWLDAACLAAASSNDERLSQYTAAFAAALTANQEADGYLGIEIPALRGGNSAWDLWNIKYAMAGLLTHFEIYREKPSLEAAARCGDWLINQYGQVSDAANLFYRSPEDGGVSVNIIAELVRLSRFTGDRKYLEFVISVVTHFPPIARMRETSQAPLMHAYNLTGFLGGVVDLIAVQDDREELRWIEKVWENIVDLHLYPTGSLGYNELLRVSAPNDTPVENGQPERHHQETCATVEWLLLNSRLYQATGKVRYVEKMEQTIYNALLAAQSMDGQNWMYYTPLRYEKKWFSGPTSCCYWSGPRGVARLPGWIYALDSEGIRVNLYESSEASFLLDGHSVAVRQFSHYPDKGKITFHVQPEDPFSFRLRLRIPFTHKGCFATSGKTHLHLNGCAFPTEQDPDGYYRIQREWSMGDQVELEFDIPITVQRFLNDQYGLIVRGPEVLTVDQRDNPAIDLDRLALLDGMALRNLATVDGRRRYEGEVIADGKMTRVVFTPYADCGGESSRFRTAFPIHPSENQ